MTELAKTESSAIHDRVGRVKAGMQDSATLRCVATEEAMRKRQTRLGAHDRPWAHTIEVHTLYGNYVTTENSLSRQTWTC